MQTGFGFQGFGFNRPNSGPLLARWWTQGAKLDADFANNRYYHNGRVWGDETAFLNAVSGSKSGITRTIGPYVDPTNTNRFTNGDFATDLTGWTEQNSATKAFSSGQIEITTPGGVNFGGFSQGVAGILGRAFRFQATRNQGTNGNGFFLRNAVDAALSNAATPGASMGNSAPITTSGYISANADPAYLGVRASSSAAGTAYFDDLSLVECWPFLGWTPNAVSFAIQATAPASIAANEVLWQSGPDLERDRIRVVRQVSDKHIVVIVTSNNNTLATLDTLVAVNDSEAFGIAVRIAPSDYAASLNGGVPVTSTASALVPGASHLRIGRSYTGDTWTGTIERVTVL